MRFSVVNLGCKVNRVESDSFALKLLNGSATLSSVEEADVVIINTCAVTAQAEKKTRKEVRRVVRANSQARIVVTGCSSFLHPDYYRDLSDSILVCEKKDVSFLLERLLLEFSPCVQPELIDTPSPQKVSLSNHTRAEEIFPTRVGLKIQDGCDHHCSYCIVRVARGRAWSVPYESILKEAQEFERLGVKEIVLTGIDLGSYSYEEFNLAKLLRGLVGHTSKIRYRISSIEPLSVTSDLLDVIKAFPDQICRHFHLPLQSGSDKVLREMNRPYCRADFISLCENIYETMPNFSLSTDIIVGFPGETEHEFEETIELVQQIGFSKVHIFRYSMREGTPAAERIDQVPASVKEQRAHQLREVAAASRNAFAQRLLGTNEDIVVEKQGWGTTESYFKVALSKDYEVGSRFKACLTEYDSSGIFKV